MIVDVRFGSEADLGACLRDVRITINSGLAGNNLGNWAMFAAIRRRGSSLVSSLAAHPSKRARLAQCPYHLSDGCSRDAQQLDDDRRTDVIGLMQSLRQAPTIQWQEDDVKYQYRQQVKQQCICDESEVAAYSHNPKVDHVLHAERG